MNRVAVQYPEFNSAFLTASRLLGHLLELVPVVNALVFTNTRLAFPQSLSAVSGSPTVARW
jgi:hypothetical protein